MLPLRRILSSVQQDVKFVCLMHPGILSRAPFHPFSWWNGRIFFLFGFWVPSSSLNISVHQQYYGSEKLYQVFCYRYNRADKKLHDHRRLSINSNNMFTHGMFLRLPRWLKLQKKQKQKTLQTFPEISCTIIYFPPVSSPLRTVYNTINFNNFWVVICTCHLQTVKYLFPVEGFYLLLKYVFMSNNIKRIIRINTTLKLYSVMPLVVLFFSHILAVLAISQFI